LRPLPRERSFARVKQVPTSALGDAAREPEQVSGRKRALWTLLFVAVTAFWVTAAIVPGPILQRGLSVVLALVFATSAWRAGVRGQLDAEDDDEDERIARSRRSPPIGARSRAGSSTGSGPAPREDPFG
jgi:hypothetical protein